MRVGLLDARVRTFARQSPAAAGMLVVSMQALVVLAILAGVAGSSRIPRSALEPAILVAVAVLLAGALLTWRLFVRLGAAIRDEVFPYLADGRSIAVFGAAEDITDLRRADATLRDRSRQFGELFERNPNPLMMMDGETNRYVEVNQAALDLYGYSRDAFARLTPYQLRAPECVEGVDAMLAGLRRSDRSAYDTVHLKADGTRIDVHVTMVSSLRAGRAVHVINIQDMTELRATMARLEQSEANVGRAQRLGKNGDWWLDFAEGSAHWSDEMFRIFGLPKSEGVPPGLEPYRAITHPDDIALIAATGQQAIETREQCGADVRSLRRDGSVFWTRLEMYAEYDAAGNPSRLVGTVQDISERKFAEAELEHSAHFDRLTDLPNRQLFSRRLETAIASADATQRPAAVLFIDVDEFKTVNDTLGHTAGDVLLTTIANRLRAITQKGDSVARLGGDEFIAVLTDVDEARAGEIARKIAAAVGRPIRVLDRDLVATVSVGIAMFPRDGRDAETLIRNADSAMYAAKRSGRGAARFFEPEMHEAATRRLTLDADLRAAIVDRAFTLDYQPIFAFGDDALVGCEALLRWPQPDGSVRAPAEFLSYAQESGLIVPIGTWVLRTVCAQNAAWRAAGLHVRASVNVAGTQLAEPDFISTLASALHDTGLPPDQLELELTEIGMSADLERIALLLAEVRALGVRVAMDNFGTGFNSLTLVRSITVDSVKLDKSFISGIAFSVLSRAIAAAVIATAHRVGATAVAEGIETVEQREVLKEMGFDAGQGYLLARPMTPARIAELYAPATPPHAAPAWSA